MVEEFDKYVHLGHWETPYMRFLREHDAGAQIERTARSESVPRTDEWATQLAFLPKHSHSELLTNEVVLGGARQ